MSKYVNNDVSMNPPKRQLEFVHVAMHPSTIKSELHPFNTMPVEFDNGEEVLR